MAACAQLTCARRRGHTIVAQAKDTCRLGARTTHRLPHADMSAVNQRIVEACGMAKACVRARARSRPQLKEARTIADSTRSRGQRANRGSHSFLTGGLKRSLNDPTGIEASQCLGRGRRWRRRRSHWRWSGAHSRSTVCVAAKIIFLAIDFIRFISGATLFANILPRCFFTLGKYKQ